MMRAEIAEDRLFGDFGVSSFSFFIRSEKVRKREQNVSVR